MYLDQRPDDVASLARSGRVYKLEEMFRELEQFKGQDLPHFLIEPQTSWFDPDVPNLPANIYKWAWDNVDKTCRLSSLFRANNTPWTIDYWQVNIDVDVLINKTKNTRTKRVFIRGVRPGHELETFRIDRDSIELCVKDTMRDKIKSRWKRGWLDGALRWAPSNTGSNDWMTVPDLALCPEYLSAISYEVGYARQRGAKLLSALMRYSSRKELTFPTDIDRDRLPLNLDLENLDSGKKDGSSFIRQQVKTPEEIVMAFTEFANALMDEVCALGALVHLDGAERMQNYVKKADELTLKLRNEVQAYITTNHASVVGWCSYNDDYEELGFD